MFAARSLSIAFVCFIYRRFGIITAYSEINAGEVDCMGDEEATSYRRPISPRTPSVRDSVPRMLPPIAPSRPLRRDRHPKEALGPDRNREAPKPGRRESESREGTGEERKPWLKSLLRLR